MPRHLRASIFAETITTIVIAALLAACSADTDEAPVRSTTYRAWTPLAVDLDPLVRMPGTQPAGAGNLEAPNKCLNCHAGYNQQVEPGFNWQGSMMAQSARDFIFWSAITVAGQDSIWALGRPNAVDLCERCHFPKGWLEGRSDPTNASAMTGADFDGVQCDFCHKMFDPHFEATYLGTREGSDWINYWDETNGSSTPSQQAADTTRQDDIQQSQSITLFNSNAFFDGNHNPFSNTYTEAGGGQYFIASSGQKRASFADAGAKHTMHYSRFHKSKHFCNACHDVSNPALANLTFKSLAPGDNTTVLPSEKDPAFSYFHIERTFSEFRLSAYGQQGGAVGIGPFAPSTFTTSKPGNAIASCQDCHMRDLSGVACNKGSGINRPSNSIEHPKSGQPLHDMTGGNILVSYVLASATQGAANYDATNANLLGQGAGVLTLDLSQGSGVNPQALLAGVDRAKQQLKLAASIQGLSYDAGSGALSFQVQNQTGHKLISGFPEGRRMFVNIKVYKSGQLIHEVNPYDATAATLKGLPASYSPASPALGANEVHRDDLVYEMHASSTLTSEQETFHMVLADGRYKDNRIPPKGFQIGQAAARQVEPVWAGSSAPGHYTSQEYSGGYDQVSLNVPTGADQVQVNLYYQVTSREFMEFLRDEIKGTAGAITLPQAAYIAQSDPFFAQLKAWGDTLWQLWSHNKDVPGAAPFLMTQASVGGGVTPCNPPVPALLSLAPSKGQVILTWSDEHTSDPSVTGYKIYYDQSGKSQLVAQTGQTTSYTDTGLTDGQTYCYKITTLYAACESAASNVKCAVPSKGTGDPCTDPSQCASGYCADGMCCNSACGNGVTTDCQACSLAAGAAQDGVCGPVAAGPVCRPSAGVCDQAETCNGISTACPSNIFKPNGTPCSGGTCQGGVCVPFGVDAGPPPDSTVVTPDGPVVTPDGPVVTPDGPVVSPDGPVVSPDGPVVSPDGPVVSPDGPGPGIDSSPAVDQGEGADGPVSPDAGAAADSIATGDLGMSGDLTVPADDGCSCEVGASPSPVVPLLGLLMLGLLWRRRR